MRVRYEREDPLERIIVVPERKQLILDFGSEGTQTHELPDEVMRVLKRVLAALGYRLEEEKE